MAQLQLANLHWPFQAQSTATWTTFVKSKSFPASSSATRSPTRHLLPRRRSCTRRYCCECTAVVHWHMAESHTVHMCVSVWQGFASALYDPRGHLLGPDRGEGEVLCDMTTGTRAATTVFHDPRSLAVRRAVLQ